MRFIFGYVTCCMTSTPCNTNNKEGSSTSRKTEEETRSLVTTAPATISRRRKRAPTRGSSADWQPSLVAIAEDNAIAATPKKVAEKENQKVGVLVKQQPVSQRNVKRCGVSSGRVNGHSSSYDFSRDSISMVIPTFSAAPFMF